MKLATPLSLWGRRLTALFALAAFLSASPALAQDVIHYWAFNDGGSNPEAWPPPVAADEGSGTLEHTFTVSGNTGHSSFAGSDINLQEDYIRGGSFVPQGDFNNGNSFTLSVSTEGYENIVINYATQRTTTGFTSQTFAYSVDGGETYTDVTEVTDIPSSFELRTVDLSGISAANDASDLRIRVTVNGATAGGGNNRFDNLTVEGTPLGAAPQDPAYLQVIHNSPDPAFAEIDIYVNRQRVVEGLGFRQATAYLQVPAEATVAVAPAGSASADDAVFAQPFVFEADLRYQLVATGVSSPRAFPLNPNNISLAFGLVANAEVPEGPLEGETGAAVNFVHGTPDAPTIDVVALGGASTGTLFENLSFRQVSGYATLPAGVVELGIALADDQDAVLSRANLDLREYEGQTVTVLASGLLDVEAGPAGTPGFALLAVDAEGNARVLTSEPIDNGDDDGTALVQIIHNAPDPAAASVDIYVDAAGATPSTEPAFAGVDFRDATAFTELGAGAYRVRVTAAGDAEAVVIDQEVELAADEVVQIVAIGVADPGQFSENPSGRDIGARLLVNRNARTAAGSETTVSLTAIHGSPDAPAVTITVAGTPLFPAISYGDITPVVPAPPVNAIIDVVGPDQAVAGRFRADLRGLAGQAATVLASGFIAPGDQPDDAPQFGVLAVFPDGTTFLLPYVVANIAAARALPLRTEVEVTGTVTRSMGAFTYFQDETAGLTVRQTGGAFRDGVNDGTITGGTRLRVRGVTSEFRGLLQINQADLRAFDVLGQGDTPEPIDVTLAEIVADGEAYEARLVRVTDLEIDTAADVFAPATNYAISDGTTDADAMVLRIPNADDTMLDGQPIPESPVVFTGVVGQFTTATPAVGGYQLLAINEGDVEAQERVSTGPGPVAVEFAVDGNYPNPFAASTTLRFDLPADAEVRVEVYDVLGRRVLTTTATAVSAGAGRTLALDGAGLAAGTYLWRLTADSAGETLSGTGRMTVVR